MSIYPKLSSAHTVGPWRVEVLLENSGGTVAHVQRSVIALSWFLRQPDRTELIKEIMIDGLSIQPGEEQKVVLTVAEDDVNFRTRLSISEVAVLEKGHPQLMFIQCEGVIKYVDDNSTKRRTGFSRLYELKTGKFVASNEAEYEFAN
jgi:hypothetical protein